MLVRLVHAGFPDNFVGETLVAMDGGQNAQADQGLDCHYQIA